MNTSFYKCCAVPMCKSTSDKTPQKLFINVPKNAQIRKKWLKLAGRHPTSLTTTSTSYFCEDHFDLETDLENYVECTTMGAESQIRMRSGVLPSKFACQLSHTSFSVFRPVIAERQRTILINESEDNMRAALQQSQNFNIEIPYQDQDPLHKQQKKTRHSKVAQLDKENTNVPEQLDKSKSDKTPNQKEKMISSDPDPLKESEINNTNDQKEDQLNDLKTENADVSEVDNIEDLVTLHVCRVCLAVDVKMYDIKDCELRKMFQKITGIAITTNNHSLMELLCWECAARLKAAAAFRSKALLSDALLQFLVKTGEQIRKTDITTMKETYKNIKSDLGIKEVFQIVHIEDNTGDDKSSRTKNIDIEILQNTKTKSSIKFEDDIKKIKEENIEMEIETDGEPMLRIPIITEMEVEPFDIKEEKQEEDIFRDSLSETSFSDSFISTFTSGEKSNIVIGPPTKTLPRDSINSTCASREGRNNVNEPLSKRPRVTDKSTCTSEQGRNTVNEPLCRTSSRDIDHSTCASREGRNTVNEPLCRTSSRDIDHSTCATREGRNTVNEPLCRTPSRDTNDSTCTSREGRNNFIGPRSKRPKVTDKSTCTSREGRNNFIGPRSKRPSRDTDNSTYTSEEGRNTVNEPLCMTPSRDTDHSTCTSREGRNNFIGPRSKRPSRVTDKSTCTSREGKNNFIGRRSKRPSTVTDKSTCTSREGKNNFIGPRSKRPSRDTDNSTYESEGRNTVIGPLSKRPTVADKSTCTREEGRNTVIGSLFRTPTDTDNSTCTSEEGRNTVNEPLCRTPSRDTNHSTCTSREGKNNFIGPRSKRPSRVTDKSTCTSGEGRNTVNRTLAKTPRDTDDVTGESEEERNTVTKPLNNTPPADTVNSAGISVQKSSPQNSPLMKVLLIVPKIISDAEMTETMISKAKKLIKHDHSYIKDESKKKYVNSKESFFIRRQKFLDGARKAK